MEEDFLALTLSVCSCIIFEDKRDVCV